MTKEMQPEALRLAECLERDTKMNWPDYDNQVGAAAELRRLHAENEEMRAERATRMVQNDRMAQRIAELEAQQKRKPLTDEQMRQMLMDAAMSAIPEGERDGLSVDEEKLSQVAFFARATERAHGIGEVA